MLIWVITGTVFAVSVIFIWKFCKRNFADKIWVRITIGKTTGVWKPIDNGADLDEIYELYNNLDNTNYLAFENNKGQTILFSQDILRQSLCKIETKTRFF